MNFPPAVKKFIGVMLILMSIAFLARLIAFLPILATEFSTAISENKGYYWGSFTFILLLNIFFWIITYYMFQYGRKLFKSKV